jgi:LAO/AO transport system kinase
MLKSTADLAQRLVARDRQALARAITLVESSNTTHRRQAELLLDYAVTLPRPSMNPNASATIKSNDCVAKSTETAKNSNISSAMMLPVRLGIAGPPGAGKSTLIENLGCQLTKVWLSY